MTTAHRKNQGFTLIELLTVIAIIGILAVITIPQYQNFSNRARFAELITAASPIRTQIEMAIQTEALADLTTLDSGTAVNLGIPITTAAAATVHGMSVTDGVITMTWRDDGTPLDPLTYILTPNGINPPVVWTVGGTCVAANFC